MSASQARGAWLIVPGCAPWGLPPLYRKADDAGPAWALASITAEEAAMRFGAGAKRTSPAIARFLVPFALEKSGART